MAGNSQRRGATSKGKGNTAGSGGRRRKGLEGRGPTPKAEDRPYHKAYKGNVKPGTTKEQLARRQGGGRTTASKPAGKAGAEWVVGRNPVFEALQAGMPVKSLYVAEGAERDSRLADVLKLAAENSLPLLQISRAELDRLTGGAVHQGLALQLPHYEYAHPDDLMSAALDSETAPLLVFCDGITDPHNLGAIIRSAAAFGAHGVLIPERRSASMTAVAWKSSAGAAARIPVGMCTNLNRAIESYQKAGFTVVGLAGEGDVEIGGIPGVDGPLVVVVGSEGDGLARLTRDKCDHLASIPITSAVESLNASVATSIALYEISRCR
ncbi:MULTISPECIES: 23S rRNA (guanosine(2251)-2'-O)-methyltransferase RlmB [unclassified Luteococcus]|uniref:23S rRNA (guanosine(2251)-2'-O)-methyltransferase RlmB n=1 Tax=unclassified Luteococcus TaxID=2639923 RepID=UPI00313D3EF5